MKCKKYPSLAYTQAVAHLAVIILVVQQWNHWYFKQGTKYVETTAHTKTLSKS